MRGYICLAVLLGVFAFLAVRYSFWVAFGTLYFAGMLVVIGIAFTARSIANKRMRAALAQDQRDYPERPELILAKDLRAA